ncbi:MAG: 1-deoxy-D-xylulose-5-phosphate synthase, partial [Lachnospiraceae bacterium]|nr:1-deoxy-D-xylulose-5-phosphate synthase [Lachnospiraceae bacterium]
GRDHTLIVTMEENVASGGFGEKVRDYLDSHYFGTKLLTVTIPDEYVEHGNVEILRREVGIDAGTVRDRILESLAGSTQNGKDTES